MQRVRHTIMRYCSDSRIERLASTCPPKILAVAWTFANEQVFVDRIDFQVLEQLFQIGGQRVFSGCTNRVTGLATSR